MKTIFFIFLLMLSLMSKGQVIADPAVSQIGVVNVANIHIDAYTIPLDDVIKLNVPVYNLNLVNSLPDHSCKVKIGLGSKMILDPQFDFSSLPSSSYFDWTSEFVSGQVQITGILKANLPANFSNIVTFDVKGSILGNSTVTTNFLVTNNNATYILSDENPANNNSFLSYAVTVPLPVTFTGLNVINRGCTINVNFSTEREINVSTYNVELSKDGVNFVNTGQLAAANQVNYRHSFAITEAITAPVVFIRIKSVDKDGRLQYSGAKSVKGLCENEWAVEIFPNPGERGITKAIVRSRQGSFNGRYVIALSDMAGKLLILKEINLANTSQFYFDTGNLSAGQYLINMRNRNGGQSAVVRWQKY